MGCGIIANKTLISNFNAEKQNAITEHCPIKNNIPSTIAITVTTVASRRNKRRTVELEWIQIITTLTKGISARRGRYRIN